VDLSRETIGGETGDLLKPSIGDMNGQAKEDDKPTKLWGCSNRSKILWG